MCVAAPGFDGHVEPAAMSGEAKFHVASLSKIFTATLLLRLIDSSGVRLDEQLGAFLPGWPRGQEISLRQLLSHTSGLPPLGDDTGAGDGPYVAAQAKL